MFIRRDNLVLVNFNELIERERSAFEVTQVAEMGMDHLLHVFRVKRDSEFELLCEVMMEINHLLTFYSVSLSVFESIEVVS